jgi:hypothetical protein
MKDEHISVQDSNNVKRCFSNNREAEDSLVTVDMFESARKNTSGQKQYQFQVRCREEEISEEDATNEPNSSILLHQQNDDEFSECSSMSLRSGEENLDRENEEVENDHRNTSFECEVP